MLSHLMKNSIVAVKLFNGVVQLELQRRQNSLKARALILQMGDMMGALLVGDSSCAPTRSLSLLFYPTPAIAFCRGPYPSNGDRTKCSRSHSSSYEGH